MQELENLHEEAMLRRLSAIWERYKTSIKVVDHIFSYLNRYWMKRSFDEGKLTVRTISEMACVAWIEVLFKPLAARAVETAMLLIDRERRNESIEGPLVRGFMQVCVDLREGDGNHSMHLYQVRSPCRAEPAEWPIGPPPGSAHRSRVRVRCQEYYARVYVATTVAFYTSETASLLQSMPIGQYLAVAEARLLEEEERARMYLHESTLADLLKALHQVLIVNHRAAIVEEFQHALDREDKESLQRVYVMLSRVQDSLMPLLQVFEEKIIQNSTARIRHIVSANTVDCQQYVSAILEVQAFYADYVRTIFANNAQFSLAFERAIRSVVNRNPVTEAAHDSSKTAELFARYCDVLLRKGSRKPDSSELEASLTGIATVVQFFQDKDVFQLHYSRVRLLAPPRHSVDAAATAAVPGVVHGPRSHGARNSCWRSA